MLVSEGLNIRFNPTYHWSLNPCFSGCWSRRIFKVESFDLESSKILLRASFRKEELVETSAFCGNDIDWFLAQKPFGKKFRRIEDFFVKESFYEAAARSECGLDAILEEAKKLDTLYPGLGMSRCFVKAVKDNIPGRLFW